MGAVAEDDMPLRAGSTVVVHPPWSLEDLRFKMKNVATVVLLRSKQVNALLTHIIYEPHDRKSQSLSHETLETSIRCRNLPYQRSMVWNGCSKRYTLLVTRASRHSKMVLGKQIFHQIPEINFICSLVLTCFDNLTITAPSFRAAIQLAILTLTFVVSPAGQHGARLLVPWFTTVHEEHFIPSRITHSPARARIMVAMHSLMWQSVHVSKKTYQSNWIVSTFDRFFAKKREPSISQYVVIVVPVTMVVHIVKTCCSQPSWLHTKGCPCTSRVKFYPLEILPGKVINCMNVICFFFNRVSPWHPKTRLSQASSMWTTYAVRSTAKMKSLDSKVGNNPQREGLGKFTKMTSIRKCSFQFKIETTPS